MDPRNAFEEIRRVDRRVRVNRRWYVLSSVVMAVALAAFYIGLKAFPGTANDLVLPWLLGTVAVLGLLGWQSRRAVDRVYGRWGERAALASLGLAIVTIVLNNTVVPDGLSVWTVLLGLLPAIPFLVLAWGVARQ